MSDQGKEFPSLYRYPGSQAKRDADKITFSYLNSLGEPVTTTRPLLSSDEIVDLVCERMERFEKASPPARESEQSRADRKYIAAHPDAVLHDAFAKMDDMQKMEFTMMLDQRSHGGNSSASWLAKNARPQKEVIGDDGRPLSHDDDSDDYVQAEIERRLGEKDRY